MTIQALGSIRFRTHQVHISKDSESDRIYCFKSTRTRCELESFDSEALAADYILEPMKTLEYCVVFPGETE